MTEPNPKPIRVFISYSHDNDIHAARVLALADALTHDGLTVVIDQYDPHPAQGWPRWMENNLDAADFVLMVATASYHRRVMQQEPAGVGLGVQWEGNLIYNRIYNDPAQGSHYIPILFNENDRIHIPTPVQGHTRYYLPQFDLSEPQYEALYRHLTNQPKTPKPELGSLKLLPPQKRGPNPQ